MASSPSSRPASPSSTPSHSPHASPRNSCELQADDLLRSISTATSSLASSSGSTSSHGGLLNRPATPPATPVSRSGAVTPSLAADFDLLLTVHSANNLKPADKKSGRSDPYVKVVSLQKLALSDKIEALQSWKTEVRERTLNPVWEQVIEIPAFTQRQALVFSVYDRDRIFRDDFLGTVTLSYDELLLHNDLGAFRLGLKPRSKKDKNIQGTITLEVRFPRLLRRERAGHDPVFFVYNGNEYNGGTTPAMLRTCRSGYKPELVEQLLAQGQPLPSTDGLEDLRISGSAQFGRAGLHTVVELVTSHGASREHIVVCDLRGEPHMILNDVPVSWYNRGDKLGANLPPVKCDELTRKYVRSLLRHSQVEVRKVHTKGEWDEPLTTTTHTVDVRSIETEEMLVHREFHLGYNRVPVTDHEAPEIADADLLVAFYQSSPPATWWHFHCAGGKGRTTTAMVLVDMLRTRHRYPHLTCQDIINRQWLIGGLRLDVPQVPDPRTAWKYDDAKKRRQFLNLFYRYTRDAAAHAHGIMFFSTWIESKGIEWPPTSL